MLLNSKYDNQYINIQLYDFLYRVYNIQKNKFIVMFNICQVLYVIKFFFRNNNWYKKNLKLIYSLWI